MKPENITANRNNSELSITWSDGHVSTISFSLLRNACPCVECRGGHENMGSSPDQEVFSIPAKDDASTRLVNIELIGSYAITVTWEDGHHYGIYRWDYLRELCQCDSCSVLRA